MRKNGMVDKNETVKEKITMDNKEKALLCHKEWNGKLETVAKSKVKTREDLAIAYTPGVAIARSSRVFTFDFATATRR